MEITSGLDLQTTWQAVQEVLKDQLSAPSYETWIAPLDLAGIDSDTVTLVTTSSFNRDWIQKNYRELIAHAFAGVLNTDVAFKVAIDIREKQQTPPEEELEEQEQKKQALQGKKRVWTPKSATSQLNPRYTFDQFIVGSHNRFAHAAALAVAESPAQSYNPLFVYGGVGLGKTHLMQGIGHFIQTHRPDYQVRYVTTEQFTNDLITAIGKKDMTNFRNRYRRMDVLMIDDIQFLEGKERTQEEIFHTFNTLHEAGKQIVISSDRPPERLSHLEDRLRSRFAWGLIADIQPPDFETRMAIVRRKAQQSQMELDEQVIGYVAESYPTNIRELEGALNKLSAYVMLTGCEVDLQQAQMLLGKRFDPARLDKEDIVDTVARYYHLQKSDLQSNLRTKHIAHARQVAIYVLRELTGESFPQIGKIFGGRRHTTILYGYEKMKEQLAVEPTLKQQVQEIMDQIKSRGS